MSYYRLKRVKRENNFPLNCYEMFLAYVRKNSTFAAKITINDEKIIKGIKYLLNEENLTAEVIQKKGYEGDIIIPETVVFKKVAYRVTSIGDGALCDCESLTNITIPDSVTSIGDCALKECSSLTSIIFQGTMAQWNEIDFGNGWNDEVPIKVIHCTDGDVEI